MIRAAFYAPMKSPNSDVPSGDRAMARALQKALSSQEIETELASELQSRDGAGNPYIQDRLLSQAQQEKERVIRKGHTSGWDIWMTYHNYYKAPDLIGPDVSKALGIPYFLVESTRARKRLSGPWARFAALAETATDAAAAVFFFTKHDEEALRAYGRPDQKLVWIRPFLARDDLPPETSRHYGMLSVGMFRAGDKTASFQLIADTLQRISAPDWSLRIAGDGPKRKQIEDMMSPFGNRVRLLGAQDAQQMQDLYSRSSILFWPGVNEAFGMTYLEAQAAGLTVLAQDRPGVRDILSPDAIYPSPHEGACALATRLDTLLQNPNMVSELGKTARKYTGENHLMPQAGHKLKRTIEELLA